MKKVLSLMIALALVAGLLLFAFSTNVLAQEVTLSSGGSLSDALAQVADGGTIKVDGTVAVTAALGAHDKTVTVTGGALDFTGFSGNVQLGDHITFENITLNFEKDTQLYANGYRVKMGDGVAMPNPIKIFGGKKGGTTASTELTLLSGYYAAIYGGGYDTNITGNTHLYVGGNVNKDIDAFSHDHTHCVYGGSYISTGSENTIGGTVTTVFTGNAKANYLYGGNNGAVAGKIVGGVNLTVSGGNVMSVYGGGRNAGTLTGNTKVLISGGAMEQVFGGCEGSSMTGDVKLDITGGTITRRVYGGCYNNTSGLSFSTSYYVTGKIMLTLHSGANIDFTSSENDRSIYAHSRQSALSATEETHLVYADATSYANYKDKVKAQDGTMKLFMGSTSAADHIHYHTYSASGAVITQNCLDSACSASATLVVEGTPAYVGEPVKPAKVVYSGNWVGGELEIQYANNTAVGTGTASITCGGATASVDFAIAAADMAMNGQAYASISDAIAAAKQTPEADTITLLGNVEVTSHMVINTEVILIAEEAVTITAADTQTGSMFRVVEGGKLTIQGSTEAPITLTAGVNTTNLVVTNGGETILTNVKMVGNENPGYGNTNKACGIFNDGGTVTAKGVQIESMKGDGIYILDDGIVNLDDVTISGSGRYGIKVKGMLNLFNTVCNDHALSISGSADHAMDVENGGKVVCDFANVPADTCVINLFDNMKEGLNVRAGGDATISNASGEN